MMCRIDPEVLERLRRVRIDCLDDQKPAGDKPAADKKPVADKDKKGDTKPASDKQ